MDKEWVEQQIQRISHSDHPYTDAAITCYHLCAGLEAGVLTPTAQKTAFRRVFWILAELNND